uniref:Cytochrome P450 2B4 n=1 Tax=Magallana gigas TaxID=29159 RepID=K1R0T8_MAGGI
MQSIPQGILLKNENKTNDMIEILEHLQQYVPGARSAAELEQIQEREDRNPKMRAIPVGDQLTYERISGTHMARLDGDSQEERLEGLITMVEDFHEKKMNFLQVVVVCGYEMLREVFVVNGDATSDRPQNYLMKELSENAGVLATSGPVWRELRNFCLRTLRDLGYNKRIIDNRVQEEIPYVLDEIEHCIGQPFDIKPLIQMSISNIVCSIVYGKRYDYQDPEFRKLIANMSTVFEKGSSTGAINFFPFLRFLPGDLFGVKKLKECNQVEVEFNKQRIKDHKTFFNPRDPPRDYIDSILFAQTKTEMLNKTQVYHHISEMFAAGTDTTATALRWALLYLIHYPEVQDKMASEIMQVTDGARLPVIADKVNMPYSTAVVTEVLRMGNVAPLSLPHVTSQDFTVAGYLIPKDTTLIPCLSSFTHDADMFPNPHKFDPGRYINSEGFLTGQEKVLAFSLGL